MSFITVVRSARFQVWIEDSCYLVPTKQQAVYSGSLSPLGSPSHPAVSAGSSGPVPAPYTGAQGLEYRERRGEQVWCHGFPIMLPALSEWLCLPSACVSVMSPCLLRVSSFFLPRESARKNSQAGEADV